jgi:hypothetical protein
VTGGGLGGLGVRGRGLGVGPRAGGRPAPLGRRCARPRPWTPRCWTPTPRSRSTCAAARCPTPPAPSPSARYAAHASPSPRGAGPPSRAAPQATCDGSFRTHVMSLDPATATRDAVRRYLGLAPPPPPPRTPWIASCGRHPPPPPASAGRA